MKLYRAIGQARLLDPANRRVQARTAFIPGRISLAETLADAEAWGRRLFQFQPLPVAIM